MSIKREVICYSFLETIRIEAFQTEITLTLKNVVNLKYLSEPKNDVAFT